jgi:hypothetical protein
MVLSNNQGVGGAGAEHAGRVSISCRRRFSFVGCRNRPPEEVESEVIERGGSTWSEEIDDLARVGNTDRQHQVWKPEALISGAVECGTQASAHIGADDSVESLRRAIEMTTGRFGPGNRKLTGSSRCVITPGGKSDRRTKQRRQVAARQTDGVHGKGQQAAFMAAAIVELPVEFEDLDEIRHRPRGRHDLDPPSMRLQHPVRHLFELIWRAGRVMPRQYGLLRCETEVLLQTGVVHELEIEQRRPGITCSAENQ